MASVENPTYMLAPNWTFRRGGTIALGNIIVDPFKPHRVLSKPVANKPSPKTENIIDNNWKQSTGKARSVNFSIWAQFLQTVGVSIGTENERSSSRDFAMQSLETIYYSEEPSLEEIIERVKDPKVRELMRLDSYISKPVYMITGLKIAQGFELSSTQSSRHDVNVAASAPITPEVSLGIGAGHSNDNTRSDGFQSTEDIVFAYQLLKIIPKGLKEKKFETNEYQSKATFLGDDNEEEDDVGMVDLETTWVSETDLAELRKDKKTVVSKFTDGDSQSICTTFSVV